MGAESDAFILELGKRLSQACRTKNESCPYSVSIIKGQWLRCLEHTSTDPSKGRLNLRPLHGSFQLINELCQ